MTAPHWKVYEPIEQTLQFDEHGAGPIIDRVQITANVHPSDAYPEQRIQLVIGKLAAAGITVEQVDEVIDLLQHAKADVIAARIAGLVPGREVARG